MTISGASDENFIVILKTFQKLSKRQFLVLVTEISSRWLYFRFSVVRSMLTWFVTAIHFVVVIWTVKVLITHEWQRLTTQGVISFCTARILIGVTHWKQSSSTIGLRFPREQYWPFLKGIHRSQVYSPYKLPIMRNSDGFFVNSMYKLLNKQWSCRWFESHT